MLSETQRPQPFPVLLARVRHQADDPQMPEYMLRTCLRFWMSRTPPLVEKVRTFYGPHDRARFAEDARSAWDALASPPA